MDADDERQRLKERERGIEAHKETLENKKKFESEDPKTTERLESSIRNLEDKIKSFVNQLNSIN